MKPEVVLAEFIGTFTLSLAVLASVWHIVPAIALPVIAGLTLGLFVLSIGEVSGAHLNPAITVGMYGLRKIDGKTAIAYLIAQIGGALLAMVAMSLFLSGDLSAQLQVFNDYNTFFAEFLGTFIFSFGFASAVHHKYKGLEAATTIGGSLLLGMFIASLGSNGLINPAVATAVSSFNWSYLLGPLLGAIIGMNAYALVFGKKGKI